MDSRSMRLSFILLASLLLAGTLLLAACGGGSTTTTTASSTQTSVTSPGDTSTSQAALTPKYGGTLRAAILPQGANIGWPVGLTAGGDMAQAYYDTLLRSDEKGNLYAWLAESYKVADDLKSITFTIRKGVKFSDGSDLTADVVKWNLEQQMAVAGAGAPPASAPAGGPPASDSAGAPPASAPAGGPPASDSAGAPPASAPAGGPPGGAVPEPKVTSIEVVDPNTVRVNLRIWDSSVLASFGDAQPGIYMVSKAAYDKNGQEWMMSNPVGTGAFTVASYAMDGTAKLMKNPNYWGKDAQDNQLPYLDEIDFTFSADNTTELMMAKSGEVDMIVNTFSGKQLTDYKDLGWRTNFFYDANEVWAPDSAHPDSPWSKLEVRQAAEYAVDRATIAEKFGYGFLQAPNQIPPRSTTAYDPNYSLGRNYDPAKAKELLAQAGYPDGFKTSLIVWQGGNRDIALAEQAYLARGGHSG